MRHKRGNFDAFMLAQNIDRIANFNGGLSCKDEKELPCAMMQMSDLGNTRRHTLLNDADLLMLDEMPAIATLAP